MMKRWAKIWPHVPGATRRLEAILATGMPGLYRVIAFLVVQRVYSLGDLGRAGVAFAIAQTLAFFTAIGWAGLVLVRVPAAPDRARRVQRFYELAFMGMMTLSVCSVMTAIIGRLPHFDFPVLETVVILAGWTVYQLTRHYFLAHREYRFIVLSDAVLLLNTHKMLVAFLFSFSFVFVFNLYREGIEVLVTKTILYGLAVLLVLATTRLLTGLKGTA